MAIKDSLKQFFARELRSMFLCAKVITAAICIYAPIKINTLSASIEESLGLHALDVFPFWFAYVLFAANILCPPIMIYLAFKAFDILEHELRLHLTAPRASPLPH